jgi:hypothetical protein
MLLTHTQEDSICMSHVKIRNSNKATLTRVCAMSLKGLFAENLGVCITCTSSNIVNNLKTDNAITRLGGKYNTVGVSKIEAP